MILKDDIVLLNQFKEERGTLFVVEENEDIDLNFQSYSIFSRIDDNKIIKESDVIIIIRGFIEIDGEKIFKGSLIHGSILNGILVYSEFFIGLLLSNFNNKYANCLDIKFPVKRIFFVDSMPVGSVRGQHAHSVETEFLYSVNGDFEVEIKDIGEFRGVLKKGESIVSLPGAWTSVKSISDDGILLAFLSHKYDASGFIKK